MSVDHMTTNYRVTIRDDTAELWAIRVESRGRSGGRAWKRGAIIDEGSRPRHYIRSCQKQQHSNFKHAASRYTARWVTPQLGSALSG